MNLKLTAFTTDKDDEKDSNTADIGTDGPAGHGLRQRT